MVITKLSLVIVPVITGDTGNEVGIVGTKWELKWECSHFYLQNLANQTTIKQKIPCKSMDFNLPVTC